LPGTFLGIRDVKGRSFFSYFIHFRIFNKLFAERIRIGGNHYKINQFFKFWQAVIIENTQTLTKIGNPPQANLLRK